MEKLEPTCSKDIYDALIDRKAYIMMPHPDGSGHSMNSLFDMHGGESEFAKSFKEVYSHANDWVREFSKDLYKSQLAIFIP